MMKLRLSRSTSEPPPNYRRSQPMDPACGAPSGPRAGRNPMIRTIDGIGSSSATATRRDEADMPDIVTRRDGTADGRDGEASGTVVDHEGARSPDEERSARLAAEVSGRRYRFL